jgi:hypothetical protein
MIRWSASPMSLPAASSPPPISTLRHSMLSAGPRQNTRWRLRSDLSKLPSKGLVERVPKSRRYRLLGKGYSFCVAFLKLFEKVYAPLAAGLLQPSAEIAHWRKENAANSTVCISASAMAWMRSCERSASSLPRDQP